MFVAPFPTFARVRLPLAFRPEVETQAVAELRSEKDQAGKRPAEVGKTADLMNLRLVKCQLGLFGYRGGKIVKPQPPDDPDLTAAIESASVDQRLSCEQAWSIAARFNLRKLNFGGVCEALGVKIKPCQLGAF